MRIMQRTGPNSRKTLSLTRDGVVACYWRPKVGGGWYGRNYVTVPWPWKKVD